MSELLTKRLLFSSLVPRLIDEAVRLGYGVTFGEVMRDPRVAKLDAIEGKGIVNSLHLVGLAVDLNLYKSGAYLTDGTGHTALGPFWKSLSPLCAWGGDFKMKDWNHYSVTYQGRR